MEEFLKEENYLDYGRLARKLIGMDLIYASPFINITPDALKVWKELASNQEELLNFVQDETQPPRSRAKAFWLLITMHKLKNYGKSDIQVIYPVVADMHILLRLFLKLFETDTTFHVWQKYIPTTFLIWEMWPFLIFISIWIIIGWLLKEQLWQRNAGWSLM